MIPETSPHTVYTIWQEENKISENIQENEVKNLTERLLGNRSSEFLLSVNPSVRGSDGHNQAVIKSHVVEGVTRIHIVGSTGVTVAWGLHHYLKYYCLAHISWETDQLALPKNLPEVQLTLTSNDLYRYYQNVCTAGYSFVWWQWPAWERHIDWMALNGINMPLAFNGQEEIWRRVWTKLGLGQQDLDEHFAGPAFLPWGRMGNLRGWGGPLTRSWHKMQVNLQHKILARMRNLGMMPILPAFAGQVPNGYVKLNPNSTYTKQNWQNFNATYSGVYLLSPTDPKFKEIGTLFIEEQAKEFGTNHLYNCDVFNEMRPSNNSAQYLSEVGQAVYQAMSGDSYSIWVMQGWLFLDSGFWGEKQTEALLRSVPQGRMLVLDLDSTDREQYTRTHSYYGQPFIFNMIHTFGGQLAMFGRKDNVNTRPVQARAMPNSSMVGTGFTPEGIHNSYVMYDLLSEMSWRKNPIKDLTKWFEDYAVRRYGSKNILIAEAWRLLANSVYSSSVRNFHGHVLIIRPPQLGFKDLIWYNVTDVVNAWGLFVAASEEFRGVETFEFDLVDLTRQALANIAPLWFYRAEQAYRDKKIEILHENALVFTDVLKDMEEILGTNTNFMLGPWFEAAKALATNEEEARLYEFNACNQITLWGPDGQILDYGGKQWAGMMKDYYIPRWKMFFKALETCIIKKTKFDKKKFKEDFLATQGRPFCKEKKHYPTTSKGNTIDIAKKLYTKWKSVLI